MNNVPAVINTALRNQSIVPADVNLMMPSETYGQVLGEFDKVTIEVVGVDPDPKNGDVYEIDGKFALGKVPLQKIASALSIIWDPNTTGIVEETPMMARAKATGAMRKPNGEYVVKTAEKTIDLSADEDRLRLKYEEDADKGNFAGKVIEWGESRNGKKFPLKFEPWKSEQEKDVTIDRAVRKALLQRRTFKAELANTGAHNRVIREFIGIKNSYTQEELKKPFAFPRVTLDTAKMLKDPEIRAAAIGQMTGSVASLFGPAPLRTVSAVPKLIPVADPAQADSVDDDDWGEEGEVIPVDGVEEEIAVLSTDLEGWKQADTLSADQKAKIDEALSFVCDKANPTEKRLEKVKFYLDRCKSQDEKRRTKTEASA